MDDEDYDFSDDDLDDLPANTLQHLEASAFRATQRQALPAPESDYGLDDGEEVINLNDAVAQSEQSHDGKGHAERINKLEQDKVRERRERDIDDLRGKLQTKSGEADTLRRRHDADTRRYERQLADQQHAHSIELARLRAEMDRMRRDQEAAHTDTMFNEHEAREAVMAKRPPRPMAARPKPAAASVVSSPAGIGTPKRVHKARRPLGDGFDNEDHVLMPSPSKTRDRHKSATPKHLAKRKRHVDDQSPIPLPALQLSEPQSRPQQTEQEPHVTTEPSVNIALLQPFRQDHRRFNLLHRLLSCPSSNGTDRIFEALTRHTFPSQPSKRLSSIVYDSLTSTVPIDVHQLALHICGIFCHLWKRCQNEKYYAPTPLILDALHFILACEPVEVAVEVGQRAVPLIIAFVDLVSDPVSKAAKGGESAIANLYSATQLEITSHVDVVDCLELLYVIATSSVSSSDLTAIGRLWQSIPSTFACMLLVKEQPRSHITLMLRILCTSALHTSIGPIALADAVHDSQVSSEDALINRLTNLFTETPKALPGPPTSNPVRLNITDIEVWDLRLLVLSVLTQFSIFEYGSVRLAQNRLCIGRLIKYLDYCITSLYRQPLSPTQGQKVKSINVTMRLIYRITTSHANFDIKSKLVNTLGGQHAYLVSLTRLAFSEGLVLEHGIEDEVVNMAHDILDEELSLEEGDAFGKVYSSGSTTL